MTDLKSTFEQMGFINVKTYIQSGNVIFETTETNLPRLTTQIETTLTKKFNYKSLVVVITEKQLKETVQKAPEGFGQSPDKYKYDVIFLKPPLTSEEAKVQIITNPEVDQKFAGVDVLYFSRDSAKLSKSRLHKLIALKIYKSMTVRNWNTTTKLLEMINS
ncbi:MAG: DUF1697 domain-containing protein [Candidatus Dojkabacteria bacterium]